jgi:hypothetical protein
MKRILPAVIFLAAASLCFAAGMVEATASVDKNSLELGDVVRYTVTVKKSGGGQAPAVVPPSFEGFRTAGTYSSNSMNIFNSSVQITTSIMFDLVAVKSGEIEIPPARVQFYNPDTKKNEEITTKSVKVTVTKGTRKAAPPAVETPTPIPAPVQARSDIREIKMNLSFRLSDLLPYIILGLVFGFAVLLAAKKIFGKKREISMPPEPADYREEALKRVNKAAELLKKGLMKEYYYELYEAVREYISAVYGVSFKEMTTAEIIRKIKSGKLSDKKETARIEEFLRPCDAVKFAGYVPSEEETENTRKKGIEIIETV